MKEFDNFLNDIKKIFLKLNYEKDLTYNFSSKFSTGDICFPLFQISKELRISPKEIADKVISELKNEYVQKIEFLNGYLNVFFEKSKFNKIVIQEILEDDYQKPVLNTFDNQRIVVEYSSPNTNKPLHLGHLRNDILGECLSRILEFNNADVKRVDLVNDRGVHICKSMLAYKMSFDGKEPKDFNEKSDKFVGRCYVEYSRLEKEDPSLKEKAEQMLRDWEAGDEETIKLWKKLGTWAIEGIKKTYELTGVKFDKYYFESDLYLKGKEEIYRGFNDGVFYKAENGAILVDLEEYGLGQKALLRADGTSIYISQDIATIIARQKDLDFQKHIYVVGSEQIHHFKVLFKIIEKLGYSWAKDLYHLSYGMVNLPDGKMKSREGTVVDADNLIYEVQDLVKLQMQDSEIENKEKVTLDIAIGSVHYYLLQVSSPKDMTFDKENSISFNGNTGAYLQYTCARIRSIFEKANLQEKDLDYSDLDYSCLSSQEEWGLLNALWCFKPTVKTAGLNYNPSLIANYTYSLAQAFSSFYSTCPVNSLNDKNLKNTRIALVKASEKVLKKCLHLMNIPYISKM